MSEHVEVVFDKDGNGDSVARDQSDTFTVKHRLPLHGNPSELDHVLFDKNGNADSVARGDFHILIVKRCLPLDGNTSEHIKFSLTWTTMLAMSQGIILASRL